MRSLFDVLLGVLISQFVHVCVVDQFWLHSVFHVQVYHEIEWITVLNIRVTNRHALAMSFRNLSLDTLPLPRREDRCPAESELCCRTWDMPAPPRTPVGSQ